MKLRYALMFSLGLGISTFALAHDAWIDAKDGGYAVLWGHGEKVGSYKLDKVKAVAAFNAKGDALKITPDKSGDTLRFKVAGHTSLLTLTFESGFYTKTTEGSKALPKNEVPNAVSSSFGTKFGKTVVSWSKVVTQAQGQKLEIVPQGVTAPKAGATLPVQVLFDGKPLAGVKLNTGSEHADAQAKLIETDAEGKASVPVVKGRNSVSAGHKVVVANNPQYDNLGYSANLIFDLR